MDERTPGNMSGAIFLYITTPGERVAQEIASVLVEERLAVCANIIPGMTSVYRWEGAIARDEETIVIIKTTEAAAADARTRIEALHPHDTPCIVALPIAPDLSSARFIRWIEDESSPAS